MKDKKEVCMKKVQCIKISQGTACGVLGQEIPEVSQTDISKVLNALEHLAIDAGRNLTISYTTNKMYITLK